MPNPEDFSASYEEALLAQLRDDWRPERHLGSQSLKIRPISDSEKNAIRNLAAQNGMTVRFYEDQGQLYLEAIRPRAKTS